MKRILSLVLLSTLLLGGTPVSLDKNSSPTSNKDTIVKEDINGKVTDNVAVPKTDGDGTPVKVTNWPARQELYGTVLRSLNAKYDRALYKPKFKDVSFLRERAKAGLNIPVVYTDNFDTPDQTVAEDNQNVKLPEDRETNILGEDILVIEDKWDENSNSPIITAYHSEDKLNKALAITACFKSLGAQKYNIYMKTSPYDGEKTLPITKTPFVTMVGANDITVNTTKYFTDVYLSRTVPDQYWATAKQNGMVFSEYVDKATNPDAECWQNMKLGDLALYLKDFLYLNGEPVMTDQEEEYLTAAYGRDLPMYLPSHEIEAVKYLMARGIIGDDDDFKNDLTCGQLMTYLMRAKDKESRLTFKQVELTYDKDMVKSGFYPVDLTSTNATMYDSKWTEDTAGSSYFDYFVQVNSNTTFRDSKGRTLDNLYVADDYNSTEATQYKDSTYLGIENGYYHFQIPTSISTGKKACIGNYLSIRSGGTNPSAIEVEYGGGWYNNFSTDKSTLSSTAYKTTARQAFSYMDDSTYVDLESKDKSIAMLDDRLLLAKKGVTYTFKTDKIDSFRWDGKEISKDEKNESGCYYKDGTVTIKFDKNTLNPAREMKQRLTVDSKAESVKFPAYMNANDTILVSRTFLQNSIGDCTITSMDSQPGSYLLSFNRESIIIDTTNKRITSGQCIEELDKDDKSPLVLKYSDGEFLIDYRCLKGIINDHLVLDSTNKGVKAISSKKRSESGDYKAFNETDVMPLLGDNTLTQARINTNGILSLEACYNKSNFLLYKKTTGSTKFTTLLVFKPKIEGVDTTDGVKERLKKDFNIDLGETENCTLYRLNDNDTVVEGKEDDVYKPLKMGDVIQYNAIDGYTYKIPDISTWDFKTYYDVNKKSVTSILPIVKYGNAYIDINANIDTSSGPYEFPSQLLNADVARRLGVQKGIAFNQGETGGFFAKEVSATKDNNSIQYAPVGLYMKYYKSDDKKYTDVVGKSVMYGTMAGKIVQSDGVVGKDSGYYFKTGNMKLAVSDSDKFYQLNYGNLDKFSIYVYENEKSSKVGNFSGAGFGMNALSDFFKNLVNNNIFDWGNFNLIRTFQNVDNVLTLIFIFLLNIVPRIMIMDFLVLATLSFVADYPVVKFMCNKMFDFYKILSCFQLDVDTIEPQRIWISTFWATVILGMLQQESLIHLLEWIDEWMLALLSR